MKFHELKHTIITDTYELAPSDLGWGLGYSVHTFRKHEADYAISLQHAIEKNLLKKVQILHPNSKICVVKNEWIVEKLIISFEIQTNKSEKIS